ncbi:MAG: response regulator [Alphaproteobacteria bacterium]|nr:response regulator [Alphaproteobacteria bacterium]MBV8410957.1 response regulator [Alphaproteobacteria bacterium]
MTVRQNTLQESGAVTAPVILVVEDEVLMRAAAADHLRQAGYDVMEAGNADEALRLLQKVEIDVVLSDIAMPGSLDGLGLIRWLRRHKPQVKTIVTSGSEQPTAGYGMFLSKPYRLVDLDFCVAKVLPAVQTPCLA